MRYLKVFFTAALIGLGLFRIKQISPSAFWSWPQRSFNPRDSDSSEDRGAHEDVGYYSTNDLLADVAGNEAYLAAREGAQYLLYFTGGGEVKPDLRKYPVNFTLRWIRIEDSAWGKTRRVKGGSFLSLQAPHATGSLAVIVAER